MPLLKWVLFETCLLLSTVLWQHFCLNSVHPALDLSKFNNASQNFRAANTAALSKVCQKSAQNSKFSHSQFCLLENSDNCLGICLHFLCSLLLGNSTKSLLVDTKHPVTGIWFEWQGLSEVRGYYAFCIISIYVKMHFFGVENAEPLSHCQYFYSLRLNFIEKVGLAK